MSTIKENYLLDMLYAVSLVYHNWRQFKASVQPNISGMKITVYFDDSTGKTIECGNIPECVVISKTETQRFPNLKERVYKTGDSEK